MDPETGRPRGLAPEDAPVPLDADMRYWIRFDEELTGALDDAGCFARPDAVAQMLDEYGIEDPEERRDARRLLRALGSGRADAYSEAFGEGANKPRPERKKLGAPEKG